MLELDSPTGGRAELSPVDLDSNDDSAEQISGVASDAGDGRRSAALGTSTAPDGSARTSRASALGRDADEGLLVTGGVSLPAADAVDDVCGALSSDGAPPSPPSPGGGFEGEAGAGCGGGGGGVDTLGS